MLDSFETSRAPNGAMLSWLANDLVATNQPWIIAYWHHPPYSKGSHNSETEIELIEMRQNALPILEAAGVDLVLSGHSHSYERSYLLDGHYGSSTTLTPSMIRDGGSGRLDGTGAYEKSALASVPHEGAVYAVAGSSGLTTAAPLNHPVMYISLLKLGSMILDIDGNRLDARFIDNLGATGDYFSIIKGGAPKPSVTIAATTPNATEAGPANGVFTVSRTGDTSAALTVSYAVSGTAASGSDYTPLSGSVTIPIGAASVEIPVAPVDDALVEANETVIGTLLTSADYTIGNPAAATVTIVSDDVAPTVTLAATTSTATEAGPTNGMFTVTRTGATSAALTVSYAVSGTATSGSDYAALSGSVTIPIAAVAATIAVTPVNDTLVEADETVIATLSASAAYTVGSPSSATVTIVSDDVAPKVTLAATTSTATEAGPTNGMFTVTRTGGTAASLTVNYTVGGTATSGSDYTALTGNVTIPIGAASATIIVAPVNDTLVEPDETVIATLSAAAAYTVGSPSSATVTIVSDDVNTNLPTVTIGAQISTATEARRKNGKFRVQRTGATTAPLTVHYTVSGTATAGSDYVALSGTVTIPAGATRVDILVAPIDDILVEPTETVIVTLSANANYLVGTVNRATVSITSND